jgi:hypothetical protein
MLGRKSSRERVALGTGGWFDEKHSDVVAKGYGHLLWRTAAGSYVVLDYQQFGNSRLELSDEEAFAYLVRIGKGKIARKEFPALHQAWESEGQR